MQRLWFWSAHWTGLCGLEPYQCQWHNHDRRKTTKHLRPPPTYHDEHEHDQDHDHHSNNIDQHRNDDRPRKLN